MEGRRRLPGACLSLSGNQISGIPRHQRDVVPVTAPITHCLISTQIRVVRAAVPPPGEGRQLLLSDWHAGNYWLFDDIYEGSFNARRPGGYVGREDRFYVFCMDIGKLRGALEHAELPRRDVVGTLRH